MMRFLIVALVRPCVSRELPGWGKAYARFVGSFESDGFWRDDGPRLIRDKRNHLFRIVDLREWSDRLTFFLKRWYDLETAVLVEALIRPGDRVLDVGANYGHFTLAAAAATGPGGDVLAIEPNPVAHARLATHVALNRLTQVRVRQIGLSDEAGELDLRIPGVNSGEASFAGSDYADATRVTCAVLTGDALVDMARVDFVKIDVEGFETRVLRGLAATLTASRPLVLTEMVDAHLVRAGASRGELIDIMSSAGYRGFQLVPGPRGTRGRLTLRPLDAGSGDGDFIWAPAAKSGLLSRFMA